MVWFFLGQLDALLIINFGDLADLGRYVAIMSMPMMARVVSNLVIDTLLPSLTNALASGGRTAASEVFTMYWRLLLIVDTALGCGLILFVGPISRLLGPEYVARQPLLVLATLLVVLACPGWIGASLLPSAGEQHRSIWIGLGQLALFLALFAAWWPAWRLTGAVLAYGLSLLASHSGLLLAARRKNEFIDQQVIADEDRVLHRPCRHRDGLQDVRYPEYRDHQRHDKRFKILAKGRFWRAGGPYFRRVLCCALLAAHK